MARRRRSTIRPRPLATDEAPTPPYWRPTIRGECRNGPRPCPYMGCRYHLGLEHRPQPHVPGSPGLFILPFGAQPEALRTVPHTCALDVADEGDHSGYQVAELMGISRQRGNQIERAALRKLQRALRRLAQGLPAHDVRTEDGRQ